MKQKNRILSYFVAPATAVTKMPRVFLAPVTMNASVAQKLISQQLKKQNDQLPAGARLLHVCFDLDSERIYVPNAQDFIPSQMKPLLQAAQIRISKDFGGFSNAIPIEGSPFSSLRVRSVNSFEYTRRAIQSQFKDAPYKDLTVIEANLARMPSTVKQLPEIYHNNKNFVGGYIGPQTASAISFIDELDNSGKKRKEKINLLTQKTPFILIDISPVVAATAPDKEWAVLSGYRDYLYDSQASQEDGEAKGPQELNAVASLYAIKRYLYLGWPFEEVCSLFLEYANGFGELVMAIQNLMMAAKSLEEEGYKNPAQIPYFLTFKIDPKTFPIRIESLLGEDNKLDPFKQIDGFNIIEFDQSNSFIIIESPVFISQETCIKTLKAKSRPFISRYNPATNTFDVKSQMGVLNEVMQSNKTQFKKMNSLLYWSTYKLFPEKKEAKEKINFRSDKRTSGVSTTGSEMSQLRMLSDYLYAAEQIKKICKEENLPFKDVMVLVGPLQRIFGPGVKGGFMGEKQFKDSKLKIPYQIEQGLWVTPPLIAVDSGDNPSYAQQASTLIHEYSHNLFSITNPTYEHTYHKEKDKSGDKFWYTYLTDVDERLAHKREIIFELKSGQSVDEIVRNKFGEITERNYAQSLKFRELVDEAVAEMEKEQEDEQPTG